VKHADSGTQQEYRHEYKVILTLKRAFSTIKPPKRYLLFKSMLDTGGSSVLPSLLLSTPTSSYCCFLRTEPMKNTNMEEKEEASKC
jgi:hypothetical protein